MRGSMIPKATGQQLFRPDTQIWSDVTSKMQTIALQQSPTGDTYAVILYEMFWTKDKVIQFFLPYRQ